MRRFRRAQVDERTGGKQTNRGQYRLEELHQLHNDEHLPRRTGRVGLALRRRRAVQTSKKLVFSLYFLCGCFQTADCRLGASCTGSATGPFASSCRGGESACSKVTTPDLRGQLRSQRHQTLRQAPGHDWQVGRSHTQTNALKCCNRGQTLR